MTRIEEFSQSAQDLVADVIDRSFPDAIPVLERWFDGLTRNQLIFWEGYWRENGPRTSERDLWEALKRTHERETVTKQPSFRRETVRIYGRKVIIYRNLRTGRFAHVRRRTRR